MAKHISIILLLLILFSCGSKQENSVDVREINVDFSIDRFDVDFYTATENTLGKTKEKYPFFFSGNEPDSVWINKINNKDEKELFSETQKLYKDVSFLRDDLEQLFKHIKYYNPRFKSPKVITLLSNIDHQNKVVYTKDYLLISLDVYLGATHKFYVDYPNYIKETYNKNHLIVDVGTAIIKTEVKGSNDRTFVGKMVKEGLKLYLLDLYIPKASNANKIGFSEEKHIWAIDNEVQVWKYFIENKLLFSTDTKLNKRFIDLAPFSKFYRAEDNRSPGRIGAWIGWQIVRSYVKYNDVSLQKIIEISPEEIYKNSKYKPKR
jgi:gliding motility-associated lipoprotein GldB